MSKSSSSQVRKMEKIEPGKSVYIDTGYPIPARYNEDILVILPRDPHWIFAYWDISDKTSSRLKKKYGRDILEKSNFVLRVHDITGFKKFPGNKSRKFKEMSVNFNARNWYINVEDSSRTYCIQLGIKTKDGKFIPILLSNTIILPSGRISDTPGEQWMLVYEDYEKLLKLSGIDKVGVGSLEMAKFLAKRWEYLNIVSRGAFSGMFSGVTSRGFKMPSSEISKVRNFWLIADAELIVYGATEPSASLTINNEPVQLNPDGTFSLRVEFPDGKKEFKIKAVSKDKVDERKITISAVRDTK
ncbi:MAG: hypothetical protein CVU80_00595 [Elusimicrobia bacterium HGW-Elusimicrobia-4]|nr:MAG: hypothetical protein CVU80_00595 [Elusimicrobia bacterium HGW-Elusimicrobia-4]